jgi:hypothetical protein
MRKKTKEVKDWTRKFNKLFSKRPYGELRDRSCELGKDKDVKE